MKKKEEKREIEPIQPPMRDILDKVLEQNRMILEQNALIIKTLAYPPLILYTPQEHNG
mgnify:CR=1 FL=1